MTYPDGPHLGLASRGRERGFPGAVFEDDYNQSCDPASWGRGRDRNRGIPSIQIIISVEAVRSRGPCPHSRAHRFNSQQSRAQGSSTSPQSRTQQQSRAAGLFLRGRLPECTFGVGKINGGGRVSRTSLR